MTKAEYDKVYQNSKRGLITKIYMNQKKTSARRGHQPPLYTKEELRLWFWAQPNAEKLYNDWVDSGHERNLAPSIDRLDDFKGYSFDNIRLVSWETNHRKPQPVQRVPVIQYDKNMVEVCRHDSGTIAAKNTGFSRGNILHALNGRQKTAGGFIWRYE